MKTFEIKYCVQHQLHVYEETATVLAETENDAIDIIKSLYSPVIKINIYEVREVE